MGECVLAGFEIDPSLSGLVNAGLVKIISLEGCVVGAVRSMGKSEVVGTVVGIELTDVQSFVQIGLSLQ
jgi:hypothetical protein